jgi:hypothetical protein
VKLLNASSGKAHRKSQNSRQAEGAVPESQARPRAAAARSRPLRYGTPTAAGLEAQITEIAGEMTPGPVAAEPGLGVLSAAPRVLRA